jgi:hypothetical protein
MGRHVHTLSSYKRHSFNLRLYAQATVDECPRGRCHEGHRGRGGSRGYRHRATVSGVYILTWPDPIGGGATAAPAASPLGHAAGPAPLNRTADTIGDVFAWGHAGQLGMGNEHALWAPARVPRLVAKSARGGQLQPLGHLRVAGCCVSEIAAMMTFRTANPRLLFWCNFKPA